MSVTLESKARLDAIVAGINAKTGGADADITSAVNTLIAGFGSGGGDNSLMHSIIDRSITELIASDIPYIGQHAFSYCTALETVDLHNCKYVSTEAFQYCTALKNVSVRGLSTEYDLLGLKARAFRNCTALQTALLSGVFTSTSATPMIFGGCSALHTVMLDGCENLGVTIFSGCSALTKLIIKNTITNNVETICTLGNVNVFSGTPFAEGGTGGTVYVPSALIESYQTATNWSTLYAAGTCNFVAIEGSEYE